MELKNHTAEAASKVAAVLQRAEEQGHMIDSLHASVSFYKGLTPICMIACYSLLLLLLLWLVLLLLLLLILLL
jgi:hypothetical protein